VADLHEQGKSMRESVPRELHGQWKPGAQREDVLSIIRRRNAGRQKRLIPLRMERMAASPFAFLRGAAAVMAYDLKPTPTMGYNVVLTGDAFNFYCWACGALLARAHAKTSEAAIIAGYCGTSKPLRESLAYWAEAYGDQTEIDHARLRAAVKRSETGLI
jgi:hypothetical protein